MAARPGRGGGGATRALLFLLLLALLSDQCKSQDYDDNDGGAAAKTQPPSEEDKCDGIFLQYDLHSRDKVFPRVKNATAQAWRFNSTLRVLNAGSTELKAWKAWIGFQHKEILVSTNGAVLVGGDDFPAAVGNGTFLSGYPQADLESAIDTAGDLDKIQVKVDIVGTQFGVKPPGDPMPKTIRLENEGFKCPVPKLKKTSMYVCCKKDPKFKIKPMKPTKFLPRQAGDLSMTYDVIQAYEGKYTAQVTIDNLHPLGRLDHWNLTWDWMRGEFIYSLRGAFPHRHDPSECLYGPAGQYYKDFDFSTVANCQKRPVLSDLPAERAEDEKIGKLPFCCRNGSILPTTMDREKSRSIFQLQVFKVPPDMNRTSFTPPQNWKISGALNPDYKCGPPVRIEDSEFPDPSGLASTSSAIASWQVVCNITRPKEKQARCCVSFSAYYNESVVPCNTCACGCGDEADGSSRTCSARSPPMLLPPEALLVPFANRTAKAMAWARLKKFPVPKTLPCPDNCGVSINWHVSSDYKDGWSARMTLFNWGEAPFQDWFMAVQMNKAYPGYENVYSFNGTRLPGLNKTIFFQGLPGLTFLMGEKDGPDPIRGPRVPGKQQSVLSFKKKPTPGLNILRGDGFPTKVFFNGEECSIPSRIPTGFGSRARVSLPTLVSLLAGTLWVLLVVGKDY